MKTEIVTYHNDFHKVIFPKFSAQEQNLLMGILSKIRDLGSTNTIILYPKDLKKYCTKEYNNKDFTKIINDLGDNFFNANFKIINKIPEKNLSETDRIHLFRRFRTLQNDITGHMVHLEILVEEEFAYLLNKLISNFTSFELSEFLTLKSKYSKSLYRLLKQFKQTGKCNIYTKEWNKFCEFMGIENSSNMSYIDNRVLNPVIVELSPIFKGLHFKKIKDKSKGGRGGTVVGIEFYFDPQETKNIKNTNGENNNETNDTTN